MTRPRRTRPAAGAALAVLAVVLPGCGPRTATVEGKVSYQGKSVVWGSVTLRAADGTVHQVGLNPDGTYRLTGVPVGEARVGVSSPDPKPSARLARSEDERVKAPTGGPPPGAWFPLPARYADPETSGVTVRVGGPGDIDLK
ncbi:MAG: carboxypeptidase-like regulatory domain-containing protein [Gemmataceae bacterium]|nr:carboxypeptidase-like regulatory domain-containing protein [Gemmataceae bacterium]